MNYFTNFKMTESQKDISFEQLAELIRSDKALEKNTLMYRDLLAQGNEKAAKDVKESMPQVAVSFRMEGGKAKENCGECLYHVLIDFDAKNPSERLAADELERVKTFMRTSYHARLGYESVSSLGYHAVVPFILPEGVAIDLKKDAKRSEEIYTRAYLCIANLYSVWCGHEMDRECKNINRLMGLSYDPQVVFRADARPIRLTREELGIGADGRLIKMKTPKCAVDKDGNRVSLPLGDRLERAAKMVEESGITFAPGNRHNFVMRVSFILNRMGVDEDEAAQALDTEYKGKMDGCPSKVLHSCYKQASSEFGVWMPSRSSVKTEVIKSFLASKKLKYDVIKQKTLVCLDNGHWHEMDDRMENDLFIECCAQSGLNITFSQFDKVLNSSVVPEVNPLRDYIQSLPEWTPSQPDYIAQVASTVHMATDEGCKLWQVCFPKWFVAMVAAWLEDGNVNHQVIVLIGRQGIFKSTWIRSLLPPQLSAYVSDMTETEHLDKDEQLRAAEYGLINMDELDRLSDRELNKLKSQVTSTHIDVRAAYGINKKKRVRVASYAASGNKKEFLTDQTGNRRWLPFEVKSIDSPHTNRLPYDGMYAQARYLIEHDFNYWFDLKDIQLLETHVDEFMVPQNAADIISVYFTPGSKDESNAVFLTLGEISTKVVAFGNLKKHPDPRVLGAILTKQGYECVRVGHDRTRGYYMHENTLSEIEKKRHPEVF